jgi:hypothetical protein
LAHRLLRARGDELSDVLPGAGKVRLVPPATRGRSLPEWRPVRSTGADPDCLMWIVVVWRLVGIQARADLLRVAIGRIRWLAHCKASAIATIWRVPNTARLVPAASMALVFRRLS